MAKGYTFFATKTGLEVKAASRKDAKGNKEGRIVLRFFTHPGKPGRNGSESEFKSEYMRFILTPLEAYDIYMKTVEVLKNGGKKYLKHEVMDGDKKIETLVKLERWERNGKSGYGFAIKRSDTSISVAMDAVSLSYLGELLKYLSMERAWFSFSRSNGESVDEEADANNDAEEAEEVVEDF